MKYDAIIIGTGQAGPPLALSLAKEGKKVAVIEKGELGGSCVNYGCTPTKAYLASARRAFLARNSEELGVNVPGAVKVDLRQIKRRKDKLVEESHENLSKSFEKENNISLIKGKAHFLNKREVQVNGNVLQAKRIYIDVGRRPRIPEGFREVNYLTNKSILELEELPGHLMIVGGGYVGLEFAQMFRRFGSKVTIFERGENLIKKEDKDISEAIAEIFRKEDINVRLNSECMGAKQAGDEIEVRVKCEEGAPTVRGSHLLIATGRIPNTEDLGLEKAGVKKDEKGYITVNEQLQTTTDHIFALGTCNGQGAFTHTSYNDFQIINSQLSGDQQRNLKDRILCYAAFTDPPLARIGMNEKQIKEAGIKAKFAERPMTLVARAKEMGETSGKMKIFIEEKTDKILGASFLGVKADECIHAVLDVMYAGAAYTTIRDAVHIHPTVSELIPTMLEDLKPLE